MRPERVTRPASDDCDRREVRLLWRRAPRHFRRGVSTARIRAGARGREGTLGGRPDHRAAAPRRARVSRVHVRVQRRARKTVARSIAGARIRIRLRVRPVVHAEGRRDDRAAHRIEHRLPARSARAGERRHHRRRAQRRRVREHRPFGVLRRRRAFLRRRRLSRS